MKRIILCWLVILGIVTFFISQVCYAKTIEVKTGYGYFTNSKGQITDKATLPIGQHPCSDEYTYADVANKAELDDIEVYVVPPTDEEIKEQLIINIIRQFAISKLLEEGKLDANGKVVAQVDK